MIAPVSKKGLKQRRSARNSGPLSLYVILNVVEQNGVPDRKNFKRDMNLYSTSIRQCNSIPSDLWVACDRTGYLVARSKTAGGLEICLFHSKERE